MLDSSSICDSNIGVSVKIIGPGGDDGRDSQTLVCDSMNPLHETLSYSDVSQSDESENVSATDKVFALGTFRLRFSKRWTAGNIGLDTLVDCCLELCVLSHSVTEMIGDEGRRGCDSSIMLFSTTRLSSFSAFSARCVMGDVSAVSYDRLVAADSKFL